MSLPLPLPFPYVPWAQRVDIQRLPPQVLYDLYTVANFDRYFRGLYGNYYPNDPALAQFSLPSPPPNFHPNDMRALVKVICPGASSHVRYTAEAYANLLHHFVNTGGECLPSLVQRQGVRRPRRQPKRQRTRQSRRQPRRQWTRQPRRQSRRQPKRQRQ